MKLDIVAGSGNDEFYTPFYAIEPLLKYVLPNSKIWCPFDTPDSLFVKVLRAEGHTVRSSHIAEGGDFFCSSTDTHAQWCDYIISNPPYSLKGKVFGRLFSTGKPFAMLVGVVGLFESAERFGMFRDNPFEIMYMSGRVSYLKSYSDAKPRT